MEVCDIIKRKYKDDAESILTNIGTMLNNSHQLIPRLVRYGSSLFNREKHHRRDSLKLGLPLFLYTNDSYHLQDKRVETALKRLHAGFVAFLLDIAPKTIIKDDVDLDEEYETMIRSATRSDKIVDNVKKSIEKKIYSANEMGFYLSTLLSN